MTDAFGLLHHCARRLVWCMMLAACLAQFQLAHAQSLADPTRPPLNWNSSSSKATAISPDQSPSDKATSASNATVALVGSSRKIAVINGETVRQGALTEGSRVQAISTRSVLLQDEQGQHLLPLTPGIEIRPSSSKPK